MVTKLLFSISFAIINVFESVKIWIFFGLQKFEGGKMQSFSGFANRCIGGFCEGVALPDCKVGIYASKVAL